MKREDFKNIIKIRSDWEFGKGDFELPSGDMLSSYVERLVEGQMNLDGLLIQESGDLCPGGGGWNENKQEFGDYVLFVSFEKNETCSYDEQEKRIRILVRELIAD